LRIIEVPDRTVDGLEVTGFRFQWSPDGKYFAFDMADATRTGAPEHLWSDTSIGVWSLSEKRIVKTLPGNSFCWNGNSTLLATIDREKNQIQLWNTPAWNEKKSFEREEIEHTSRLFWNHSGSTVAPSFWQDSNRNTR
jgi:hypothetical protein